MPRFSPSRTKDQKPGFLTKSMFLDSGCRRNPVSLVAQIVAAKFRFFFRSQEAITFLANKKAIAFSLDIWRTGIIPALILMAFVLLMDESNFAEIV
ncbi:hypothetical protein [[Phormidium] sp. ETS-05]|uniref:hypothetical protein n=1 Tax=[Phormidium] sp. ETS-05 TaxID=222819 RepID=UPI0018EED162|nr:hypothetical protein [[Phormidium] sp. ETS-05]